MKLLNFLKLKKACGIDGIPNECLRHFPRRSLVHLTHLINHCIRLSHFPTSWKEAKVVVLPKPGKDSNSLKIYVRLAFCSRRAKVFEKVILKIAKDISKKETCLMQVSSASTHVTARHCNV
jgi:hypothetical protein